VGALIAKALAVAVFIHAPCPGDTTMDAEFGSACAVAPNVVYVAGPLPHQTYMHELGHIIDYNFLTDQDRGTFLALIHERRWWLDPSSNSPHEKFAEAVAHCARNPRWRVGHTWGYEYYPTLYEHRKVCRWLGTIVTSRTMPL
jgi:hypothetical protein